MEHPDIVELEEERWALQESSLKVTAWSHCFPCLSGKSSPDRYRGHPVLSVCVPHAIVSDSGFGRGGIFNQYAFPRGEMGSSSPPGPGIYIVRRHSMRATASFVALSLDVDVPRARLATPFPAGLPSLSRRVESNVSLQRCGDVVYVGVCACVVPRNVLLRRVYKKKNKPHVASTDACCAELLGLMWTSRFFRPPLRRKSTVAYTFTFASPYRHSCTTVPNPLLTPLLLHLRFCC